MKLARKALPILLTLNKLNKYFNKLYCFPSQDKILELLEKFVSLKISRRQLNYDLAYLESHALIRRIRRHRKTKRFGMEFRSTLYEITVLGYNLLLRSEVIAYSTFKVIQARIRSATYRKPHPCAKNTETDDLTSISDILGGINTASI